MGEDKDEQTTAGSRLRQLYVERALFIIGDRKDGKSTQLRSLFRDYRLDWGPTHPVDRRGVVPDRDRFPAAQNLPDYYPLSNERWLYLRLTSPHEAEETLTEFLDKCADKFARRPPPSRRRCFACPLQPDPYQNMPSARDTVHAFIQRFDPERVRAVLLNPNQKGYFTDDSMLSTRLADLRALPGTEALAVDGRTKEANGLIYADFFDFT